MPTLSASEIAGYAIGAGFSRRNKHRGVREDVLAVAIALGESGGNPNAHNPRPPDNSYGLWQINMIGNLGPARRQQFGISSNEALFNPATNARAAYQVFKDAGNSFRPWSVYTNGTYLRYLPQAQQGADNPSGKTLPEAEVPGGEGAFAALGGFVDFVTDSKNWIRVAQFVGGGVLILAGVVMITGKNVTTVLPVGKIAKAVRRVE